MTRALQQTDPLVALSRAHALLDQLQALDPTGLDEHALLDYWRELERLRRRIPSLEHPLVLEVEGRDLPGVHQVRTAGQFLRGLLRLDPAEAAGRVKAARAAGARRAISGQPLPPAYAELAVAQQHGDISERQARVVVDTIERLPDQVRAEHGAAVERDLVRYARQFDPIGLGRLAERIAAYYDPDGRLTDVGYREKHRDLTINQRVDGSCSFKGEGTAELAEVLLLHLDALAKPKPEVDGVKDPRTAGQRRHDALLEGLKLTVRAKVLPAINGVTATVLLTMTADDFATRRGLAGTGHGALLPVAEAMRITGNEYRLMTVVLDQTKGIAGYSSSHRLFTESQRLALCAVDRGCTFPNCPAPPGWCQIDHALEFARGGPTSTDNGVLACRYHNNDAKKQGWTSARINGRAAWIPPRWIDAEQKPRYNLLHDPGPPP